MGHKLRETIVVGLVGAGVFAGGGAVVGLMGDAMHGTVTQASPYNPISERAHEAASATHNETRVVELSAQIANTQKAIGEVCWIALQDYSNNGALAGSSEDQVVSDLMDRTDHPCDGNVTEIRKIVRPWANAQAELLEIQDTIDTDLELAKTLEAERRADADYDGWLAGLEAGVPMGLILGVARRKRLMQFERIAKIAGVEFYE